VVRLARRGCWTAARCSHRDLPLHGGRPRDPAVGRA